MLNDKLDLPFDLYTRNKIISDLIGKLRNNNQPLRILDVGGRSGDLRKFLQEDDDLYILDIRNTEYNEKNYFIGNIINAPFKDFTFDVVVSSELYEHIVHENRERSVSEMLRVSKNYIILGAPFFSEEAKEAEIKVNEFFHKLTGNDHQWLAEHIKNGLPSEKQLKDFLKINSFDYVAIETNNISNWVLMQLFIFYSYKYGIPEKNMGKVHRFYNENFSELGDTFGPTYRKIYLIWKNKTVSKVDIKFNNIMNLSKYHFLETLIFETIGHSTDNLEKQKLEIIKYKDNEIQNLNATIAEIHKSTVWQLLSKYQRFVDMIFPHATKRRLAYDKGILGIRMIVNDGFGAFFFKLEEIFYESALNASKISIVETKIISPQVPLPLLKSLSGSFTFPSDNLNEIKILTATFIRKNSDLILQITDTKGHVIRNKIAKGYRIQDNNYTSFRFKPIKDSKEKTFSFKLISKGDPSAAVLFNESITLPELTLYYDEKPIKGSIGFQAFADIGITNKYYLWILKNEPTSSKLELYKKEVKSFEYKPKISIVTPVYNPDVAWIKAAVESVINQVYENWELCIADASTRDDVKEYLEASTKKDLRIKVKFLTKNEGIAGNSNEALSLATGDYIGLLDHDDELSPDALYEVVKYLQANRNADIIYSDEDKIDLKGNRSNPFFKPNWSPDMFLSHNYLCHFTVIRKSLIDKAGNFRVGFDGSQDYDLFLRVTEISKNITHIPKILYHWRMVAGSSSDVLLNKPYAFMASKNALRSAIKRRKLDVEVMDGLFPNSFRLKYNIIKNPKVSIIIPTKDKVDILKNCVNSIFTRTNYSNYEILIVDNQSKEKATFKYYEELEKNSKIKIVNYQQPFNFSTINNFAVSSLDSKYILFLNNDIEVISSEWITAMLEHAQRKEVGAVGAKLIYHNNTIQHAGVVIGIVGNPPVGGHAHRHFPKESPGYFGRLKHIDNVSAVTAACMMLRKDVFEEVGGFDENLAVAFNDVDLCLKIREKGYLIVYTPYAELYHHESLSRGYEDTPEKKERFSKEVKYIREKWGAVIDRGDPYYNPNLTLEKEDFSIRI